MSSGVFLLNKDGSLEEMNQEDYSSEEYLQTLLEKYPNLLAGQQIDEANPRKWIVISREFPVPVDDFSGGRYGHWIIFFLIKRGFQHLKRSKELVTQG